MTGQHTLNEPPYPEGTTLINDVIRPCFLNKSSYHSLIPGLISSSRTATWIHKPYKMSWVSSNSLRQNKKEKTKTNFYWKKTKDHKPPFCLSCKFFFSRLPFWNNGNGNLHLASLLGDQDLPGCPTGQNAPRPLWICRMQVVPQKLKKTPTRWVPSAVMIRGEITPVAHV